MSGIFLENILALLLDVRKKKADAAIVSYAEVSRRKAQRAFTNICDYLGTGLGVCDEQ